MDEVKPTSVPSTGGEEAEKKRSHMQATLDVFMVEFNK